jgi:hypothetical protein
LPNMETGANHNCKNQHVYQFCIFLITTHIKTIGLAYHRSRPTLMSLSTFIVQIQRDGGKPGCSYRAFQSQKLIIPCDPGSQSGRPGRLSPNLSDPWTGQISSGPESPGSHLGSTR